MTYIHEEPPDGNEQYEAWDEALDEEDLPGPGGGPEGSRDLDTELVTDDAALEEAGANLDDADRISLLDGGMDDPDGSGRPGPTDPRQAGAPRLDEKQSTEAGDGAEPDVIDMDPTEMDNLPADAPGPDSARWQPP